MTALPKLAVVVVVLTALTACSGNEYDDYCSVVKGKQQELSETLGEGGPDALLKALPTFRELRDAAPSDVRDDWRIVVDRLTSLEKALDDAGVDPATYDRDQPPEGLTGPEKERIDAAAQALADPESVAAFGAVDQQARDVCQTPLRL